MRHAAQITHAIIAYIDHSLQAFDGSALGGGVGGGGAYGRDADLSNPNTERPDSDQSSDPAVS